mmetsp:Transcript_51275/g.104273  ORF Transcript_51275/g.104273 Transcript_51275/m.104273 type:complete len:399 (-) Transcript_51275:1834-3030(-)
MRELFYQKNPIPSSCFLLNEFPKLKSFQFNISESFKKKDNFYLSAEKKSSKGGSSDLRLHEITDKLTYLLSLGELPESSSQEYYKGHLESTLHIAVVFCKQLFEGQISVEFARRISTTLSQIKYGKLKPDIIAFIGGQTESRDISGAVAGYVYFRHLSVEAKVDLMGLEFIIEEKMINPQDNLVSLLATLRKRYGDEAVSKCHFTLISSDYHLIRIAEIHKLSQRQSILNPLYEAGATWTYLFAAYPFCVSPDPTLAFLGRIRVLANDLTIVLVNLNGIVEFNDLVAKENFSRLCETNRKLRTMLRIMSEPGSSINSSGSSIEIPPEQWEILERSLCTIHEVQTVLTPLVNGKSVERRILVRARDIFMNAVKDIRISVDPDRPLNNHEWALTTEKVKN